MSREATDLMDQHGLVLTYIHEGYGLIKKGTRGPMIFTGTYAEVCAFVEGVAYEFSRHLEGALIEAAKS